VNGLSATRNVALIALAVWLSALSGRTASADSGLELIRAEAVSEFPEGIRFRFEARSERAIDEVIVRFAVTGQPAIQYNYLELSEPGQPPAAPSPVSGAGQPSPSVSPGASAGVVSGEYFHRTGQRDRYVPPGAEFTYFFEVLYEDGKTEETKPATLVAHDSRFKWEPFTKGPITVFYHGPVQKRAESIADWTLETFTNMGSITGANTDRPLRIVMYNNDAEMIGAVSIRSLTSARQLVTEGQAFAQHNLVIVQGGADRAGGVISHEVTHILVGRATERAVSGVPVWLNEGLAEYGNLDPGLSYVRFLEWAVDTNRLVPIVHLDNFPADPNLTIVAYGEARSILEFMIDRYGKRKVADLLSEFNRGTQFVEAMRRVYGFDPQELDRQWRLFLGAKPYEPPAAASLPTPEPQVQLTPFTLEATVVATPTASAPKSTTPGAAAGGPDGAAQPTSTPTPRANGGGGCSAAFVRAGATSPAGSHSAGPSPLDSSAGEPPPLEASAFGLLALPVLPIATLLVRRGIRRRSKRGSRCFGPPTTDVAGDIRTPI
jgi:hypothetical protein